MIASDAPLPAHSSLMTRLSRLAWLSSIELDALQSAQCDQRLFAARREMTALGEPVREQRAVVSGWACRTRTLRDGRRQILSILLPGDLIGVRRQREPAATTTILAITDVVTCPLPSGGENASGLADAYAASGAVEEHYLLKNVMRLGRFNAYERLADWFVEVRERLALAGLCSGDEFFMPLTQDLLADALGLTNVHLNRTLQAMKRDGLLRSRGRVISLQDRRQLEELVEHTSAPMPSLS